MKHQKAIKQEALRRKAQAQSTCAQVGLNLQDEQLAVGVVVNHVTISQLNFFLFESMNQASRQYAGLDLAVFALQIAKPCLTPLCPVFDAQRLMSWESPLIATSTSACLESLSSRSPLILHYVFDLDFVGRRDLSTEDLRRAFCDPRVRVITRGEDYRRVIEAEFDVRTHPEIVPNAEFNRLARIVINELKGGDYCG